MSDKYDELSDALWLGRLDDIGEDAGFFESLGPAHVAFFSDEAPTLLVTFETAAAIRARPGQIPLGYDIARAQGWSCLCIIALEDSWFRHPAVYGFFDRQVDDAFFEDFDRVLFWGAGMCGYAAAAYSVAAPGATVFLAAPQASLSPRITGWDHRFPAARRLSFTDRYGFAPDMVEGAGPVYICYDPEMREDAMHAALFARPFVTHLPCRNLGADPARALAEMGILRPLIEAGCNGNLSRRLFFRLYRARRRYGPYLRNLVSALDRRGRKMLIGLLCRNVAARLNAPRFQRRYQEIEAEFAAAGHALPPSRSAEAPQEASAG